MQNLQHPYELYKLPNEDEVVIINAPSDFLLKQGKAVKEIMSDYGFSFGDIQQQYSTVHYKTYQQYFQELVLIQQSFRKKEGTKLDGNHLNFGKPYFDNLKMALQSLSDDEMVIYLEAIFEFKKKCLPEINYLSTDRMCELVENLTGDDDNKKKTSMQIYTNFGFNMLKSFSDTLVNQHQKLIKENSQNLLSLKMLQKSKN